MTITEETSPSTNDLTQSHHINISSKRMIANRGRSVMAKALYITAYYITGGATNIIVLQNHYYISSGLDSTNTLFRHATEKTFTTLLPTKFKAATSSSLDQLWPSSYTSHLYER
jgi:hypothetical protein